MEVFALAAAIAGIGGFLLAGWKGTVGKDDFSLLTGTLSALPVLLLAVVGGITVVSGAMIGALMLVAMPQIAADYPSLRNLMILLPGLVGITLARNPDGIASDVRNAIRDARAAVFSRAARPVRRANRIAPSPRSCPSSSGYAIPSPSPSCARSNGSWASVPRTAVALFEARGLTVRFGGHNAVNDVDLDVESGCVTGSDRSERCRQDDDLQRDHRLAERERWHADARWTRTSRARRRAARARLGIARTFQQLEVFGSLTTRDNILVAAEIRRRWAHDLRSNPRPTPKRSSIVSACAPSPTSGPTRSRPAWPASASWAAPSRRDLVCCCSTSRHRA